MLVPMWLTVLMLVLVALAGWLVASSLRAPRRAVAADPQAQWEHWLEDSGLRPVLPRTRPVPDLVDAIGREASDVDRVAMGRADDGAMLVVAQLVDGTVVLAARRTGPVPAGDATVVMDGWQVRTSEAPLALAWQQAGWVRHGPGA